MKKKSANSTPTRKTHKRPQRLQSAKHWIEAYTGKNMVQGYKKCFRVDLLTAITELRMLGIIVDPLYEEAVRFTVSGIIESRRRKKEAENAPADCQNDDFAYIVGYTSGGAPYGLRWEDMPPADTED